MLIGDGPLMQNVKNLAKDLLIDDYVLFLGSRENIAELFQMFDVFVFPSLYEGLPVTLIEAQAAGLKVFASDTVTKEVRLCEDVNFLSLDNSPDFWAKEILSVLPYKKENNYLKIKKSGYDIISNVAILESFYMENNKI